MFAFRPLEFSRWPLSQQQNKNQKYIKKNIIIYIIKAKCIIP